MHREGELDSEGTRRVRRRVLAWYGRHRRHLPWRPAADAYGVWISEVMLQQTRVETVRERWPAFLRHFPDVGALAAATEDEVLRVWEGLGYYARARGLRRAARILVDRYRGELPRTREELLHLPGFGEYTCAAVLSIAYGLPLAAVDGNVVRVLARWLGEEGDVTRRAVRRRLDEVATRLLSRRRPGDWNQAMMELGATRCTPRAPACPRCPLRVECVARRSGTPERLPRRPLRPRTPHFDVAAGIVWRGGRVLIARRPSRGLLGGLWEFPGGKRRPGESLEETCVREVEEETGLRVRCVAPFLSIDHAYTHFRITLHLLHCRSPRGAPRPLGCESPRFVELGALGDYAFPRANRRAIQALLKEGARPLPLGS